MFGIARAGCVSSIIPRKAGATLFSTPSSPRSARTTNSCCWCLRQALRMAFRRNETAILRRRGSRVPRHHRAIARCAASLAMASIAARSAGKSAAIQAASAARMAAPSGGPAAMPRPMKSAALSGKTGAGHRSGRVANWCQAVSVAPPPTVSKPRTPDRERIANRGDKGAHARPSRPAAAQHATSLPAPGAARIRRWIAAAVRSAVRHLPPPTRRARRAGAPRRL